MSDSDGHSFPWMPMSNAVDRTLSSHEDKVLEASREGPCEPSSPTFWLDMCDHIPTNVSEYVNLQLNPERCVPLSLPLAA